MASKEHPGTLLRQRMDRSVVAAPGAFNALVGKAVADTGFEAVYFSGGATTVAAGVPDIGLLTLDHFAREIKQIVHACKLPMIADADTGFGEEEMVRRTVFEYNYAGAAGLHLEDQVFPKRCGHLDGKKLIPIEQGVSRIEWAARASVDSSDGAFIVCARTDAKGVEGFDAAVERARAYVEAGATMVFPEGLASEQEFADFAKAMDGLGDKRPYLLANMTEFGKTPMLTLERFGQMGYNIVIYPVSTLRIAMGAVTKALAELKDAGTLEGQLGNMQTRQELYDLVGYTPGEPFKF